MIANEKEFIMTVKFDSLCPYRYKEYKNENLEYADKVRKIVCDNLGFEPSLKASCSLEINLRKSLKRFDNNELTERQIKVHINDFCHVIKKNILRNVPEQAHLVDKQEVENYTR
ncbi:hypothetical protein Q4Q34_08580 [Flavivirga abyssicola]|uniref:hypothetical protein n=1 Tax=Flavivirga abyssicola TaxID=3063533 RepID=UPI0026DFACD4|nr:hypothetical protein [Flavivirga sp. MEBiC07777]WVK15082.1 hypothetical protein Q4Q34_08580 [Flavivirga sp. MEBiC07777]